MKKLYIVTLLLPLLTLAGCAWTDEGKLVGRWGTDCVIETVTMQGGNTVSVDTMPGYSSQVVEFMDGDLCLVIDRGDTAFYHWSLNDKTLALFREGWAEDYQVEELTRERLVYSDTYSHLDSVTGFYMFYTYTFKYNKL